MANRKSMTMIMKDDRYVDRRIKIFKVKKQGPQFDVKKIAADLKAKSQTRMVVPAAQIVPPQTKSDLFSSIRIKTLSVPVASLSRRKVHSNLPVTECTTIIDSSDEVRT